MFSFSYVYFCSKSLFYPEMSVFPEWSSEFLEYTCVILSLRFCLNYKNFYERFKTQSLPLRVRRQCSISVKVSNKSSSPSLISSLFFLSHVKLFVCEYFHLFCFVFILDKKRPILKPAWLKLLTHFMISELSILESFGKWRV